MWLITGINGIGCLKRFVQGMTKCIKAVLSIVTEIMWGRFAVAG